MKRAQEIVYTYTHNQILHDVVLAYYFHVYLIKLLISNNLWLQFDTKAHFNFIIPIYEIANEMYLVACKNLLF